MKRAKLGLGTVQLANHYGISNTEGVPTLSQVKSMLASAKNQGVFVLDTACLYGNSESILGQCDLSEFSIVTKTPRFATDNITHSNVNYLRTTFESSLNKLKQDSINTLLSHHANDLLVGGGDRLWGEMEKLKREGKVEKIGASIYEGNQVDALIAQYPLDIVQIPLNVLDQRLIENGQLNRMREKGIEVHVRSVFLQGLLLMDNISGYFDPIKSYLQHWDDAVKSSNMTKVEAALNFVKNVPGIDVVLVGVTNKNQLNECVEAINSHRYFDAQHLACNISRFVDPSQWDLEEGVGSA